MRSATYASVTVAVILVMAKTVAWLWSDSVSLLATLIDSLLDVLASLLNLFAVRHALTPADLEHRFGHGKAEALAGLGQATFVAGSAGFLLFEAGGRILHPEPLAAIGPGIAVMVFSIALTLGLVMYQGYVLKAVDSTAIRADSLHYRSDLMVNGSVILALGLAAYGWAGFDALFAIAIAIYILSSAVSIVRQSIDPLMDRELPDQERQNIERIVTGQAAVRGMHDLRSRRSGTSVFLQLHLELDDELSLIRAHQISDEVERALLSAYPGAQIIIHADPVSIVPHEPLPDFLQDPDGGDQVGPGKRSP